MSDDKDVAVDAFKPQQEEAVTGRNENNNSNKYDKKDDNPFDKRKRKLEEEENKNNAHQATIPTKVTDHHQHHQLEPPLHPSHRGGEGNPTDTAAEKSSKKHFRQRQQQQQQQRVCSTCYLNLRRNAYSKKQWKLHNNQIRCQDCVLQKRKSPPIIRCRVCRVSLAKEAFSAKQLKLQNRARIRCKLCTEAAAPTKKKKQDAVVENNCADVEGNKINTKDGNNATSNNKEKKYIAKGRDSINKTQSKKQKQKKNNSKDDVEVDPIRRMAILQGRINILPDPSRERKAFQLDWVITAIPVHVETEMAKRIVVKGCYSRMTEEEKLKLAPFAEKINMSVAQAASLRSSLLQQKALFRHYALQMNAKRLCMRYQTGESILKISKDEDYPPMNAFRAVLAEMGYSKAFIKKSLRNPNKMLQKREQNEFFAAEEADAVSKVNADEAAEHSERFENVFAEWLNERGISHVRQSQLESEQVQQFGKPVATPDFLLLDHVEINGQRVAWIDCKAYYGTNVPLSMRNMTKQMERYINVWGSGAILFSLGFSEAIKDCIDGCTMLNAKGGLSPECLSILGRS